ncbi:hypothetical protein GGI24_002823 [Coemansia furcata]|nr:hypothetical protein GGI24_002823 [Coemansia furcata]
MDNLSAFQLLPHHVVKLIVDHVSGSSRLQFDRNYNDFDQYDILLTPLLWVCHNFRALVHQRFCRKYGMTLRDYQDRAESLISSWPGYRRKLGYPTHHLATQLCIEFDVEFAYSRKALQMLSDAPYEGCMFPQVHKLEFELTSILKDCYSFELEGDGPGDHGDYDGDWDPESDDGHPTRKHYIYHLDTAANISAFVQRVKQMAPTVSEVSLSPHGKADRLFECDNHFLHLAEELFGIVEKPTEISYKNAHLVMFLNTEPIRDPVRIKYILDSGATDVPPLIRRSTQTLQFLDIDVGDADASDIFSDPDGAGATWNSPVCTR